MLIFVLPEKVFNFVFNKKWAGVSALLFIFIKKGHETNPSLVQHERYHRHQFLRTFGLHSLKYLFSKKYRIKAETEAYIVTGHITSSAVAKRIHESGYNLGMSLLAVEEVVKEHWVKAKKLAHKWIEKNG